MVKGILVYYNSFSKAVLPVLFTDSKRQVKNSNHVTPPPAHPHFLLLQHRQGQINWLRNHRSHANKNSGDSIIGVGVSVGRRGLLVMDGWFWEMTGCLTKTDVKTEMTRERKGQRTDGQKGKKGIRHFLWSKGKEGWKKKKKEGDGERQKYP